MLQLRTPTSKHDSTIQHAVIKSNLFQMITNKIHDFTHSSLDDIRQVLHTDFLCLHSSQTWYGYKCICFCFVGECRSELHFHLFCLGFQYTQPGFDIICDILTTKWNYCSMLENTFIKHCEIRSS